MIKIIKMVFNAGLVFATLLSVLGNSYDSLIPNLEVKPNQIEEINPENLVVLKDQDEHQNLLFQELSPVKGRKKRNTEDSNNQTLLKSNHLATTKIITEERFARITSDPEEDLRGIDITVAVANYPPFLDLEPGRNGLNIGGMAGAGQGWDILDALVNHFNFTPVPIKADVNLIGSKKPNTDEFHGIIDLLRTGEADFSIFPIIFTEERRSLIDFSVPIGTTSYSILVKRPSFSPKPDALLKPFQFDVWMVIVASLTVMGPFIYGIILARVNLCKNDPSLTRIFPVGECIWFVYGALMKQGSTLRPISDSSRILFATWWIYVVIVTAFYTANLTAFMTFNGLQLPIKSVKDLYKYDYVTWLANKDDALVHYIESSEELDILREMEENGRGFYVDSREEALQKVKDSNTESSYIYLDEKRTLNFMVTKQYHKVRNCDYYATPLEPFKRSRGGLDTTFWWGFGFKKGSEYRSMFNHFFQGLDSHGIIRFLHLNTTPSTQVCELPKGFKDRPLQLTDFITTFGLAAIGGAIASIAFIMEYLLRKFRKSSNAEEANQVTFIKPFQSGKSGLPTSYEEYYTPYGSAINIEAVHPQNPKQSMKHSNGSEYHDQFLKPQQKQQKRPTTQSSIAQQSAFDYEESAKNPPIGFERTESDLLRMESVLNVVAFTRDETEAQKILEKGGNSHDIVTGSINGIPCLWDKAGNKLMIKDKLGLERNVMVEDGVQFVFVEYETNEGRKFQKMVVNGFIP